MDVSTELINYPFLERNAKLFKPKIIVAGNSCCSRKLDYARCTAVLHCTVLHCCTALHCTALHCTVLHTVHQVPEDLVTAGEAPSPFQVLDHGNIIFITILTAPSS